MSRPHWRGAAIAAGLFVGVYLLPLGARPLLLPDEFRYAEVAREMLASGDWVVPRLDGVLYFEKPVLGYWWIAASEAVLGPSRFAVRLPAALAVGGTALLAALLARGGGTPAYSSWLAAAVFLSSLLPIAAGTTAVLDGPFTLFLSASLVAFFLATQAPRGSRRRVLLLAGSGFAVGLAFLTKGFLAVVLPSLVAGGYLLWQRRWRELVGLALLPAAAALAVVLPWSLAVHRQAPDFWRFFFWHEHVQRFLEDNPGQHPEPWWFFLAAGPILLLPWAPLLPAAVLRLRESMEPPLRELVRFCTVWSIAVPVFFSLSSGKLATYVLPAFPAVAVLVALGASLEDRAGAAWRRGIVAGGGLLVALALAVLAAVAVPSLRSSVGPVGDALALAGALAVGGGVLLLALRQSGRGSSAWWVAGALVPFALVLQFALPERVLRSKAPGGLLAEHGSDIDAETVLVTDSNGVRAVCWAFGRDDVIVAGGMGELRYGLERDTSGRRHLQPEALGDLVARSADVAILAPGRKFEQWKAFLPEPTSLASSGRHGWVMARFRNPAADGDFTAAPEANGALLREAPATRD